MGTRVNKILMWKEAETGVIPANPTCYVLNAENYNVTGAQSTETNVLLGNGRGASKNTYGATTISGDIPIIWDTDNMLLWLVHGVGETTATVAATTDTWADATVYAKGDIVNNSDGLHSLVCYVGGTSDALEPDLSAYTTASAGRGTEIEDGTVTWIIMPKLWKNTGERGDCLASFGAEVEDGNACTGATAKYTRKTGLFANSIGFSVSGDTNGLKTTVAVVGVKEQDSSLDESYTEMSAQAGFTEVGMTKDFWSYDEVTVKIDGEAAVKTSMTDFTITNNITVDNGVNNDKIENIGVIQISGNINGEFREEWYRDAKNHTKKSVSLEFSKANGCSAIITLPQIEMAKVDKVYDTQKNTMLNIPFSAFDLSDSKSITYEVVGQIQTY